MPASSRCRHNFGARERIWDSGGSLNWLSGYYGRPGQVGAGVAFHNGLLKNPAGSAATTGPDAAWNADWGGYDWMLHSDQWDLFRSDRVREFYNGGAWSAVLNITINDGGFAHSAGIEYSDWAVAGFLVYSCNLNTTQIKQVEDWLDDAYCVTPNSNCFASAYHSAVQQPPPPPSAVPECPPANSTTGFCNQATGR